MSHITTAVELLSTAALGTGKKNGGIGKWRSRESYYIILTRQERILDLKISGGIGGRQSLEGRYWGGGGLNLYETEEGKP